MMNISTGRIALYSILLFCFCTTLVSTCRNPDPSNQFTWVSNAGNDTLGTGSYNNPYRTMMNAENQVLVGEKKTIYVMEGIYRESHSFSKNYQWVAHGNVVLQSQSSNQVIEFSSSNSQKCLNGFIVDRENITGNHINFVSGANNVLISNCSFINRHISGRALNLNGNNGIEIDSCTIINNSGYSSIYSSSANDNEIILNNCTLNNTIYAGLNSQGKDTVTIKNCFIIHAQGRGLLIAKNIDLLFQNNIVNFSADVLTLKYLDTTYNSNIRSGKIVINRNTINLNGFSYVNSGSTGMFDISSTTNSFEVIFDQNRITGTSTTITKPVLWCYNQKGLVFNNNYIDLHTSPSIIAILTFMPPNTGTTLPVQCNYNEIYSNNTSGAYIIAFGNEITSSQNNKINDLEIIGNKIYGHRYYDTINHGSMHALFVGFNIDATIKYNTLIGCGYAIVYKHDNISSMTHGGISYNVLVDCTQAILMKGINNCICYNNTVINTIPQYNNLVKATPNNVNDGIHTSVSGIQIKNNIIYSSNAYGNCLIDKPPSTSIECNYNMLRSNQSNLCLLDNVLVTFSQWQQYGYDINSINTTPGLNNINSMFVFDARPYLNSNIEDIGVDLGDPFCYGMDQSSEPPNIVVTRQDSLWDIGAYLACRIIEIPSTPTNISIYKSATGIVISWNYVTNADFYYIYKSNNPYSSEWGTPIATTELNSWEDQTIGGGGFYKISAALLPFR